MRLSTSLMLILASFCLGAEEQGNQRKNIKLLFVPADVMASLRKNPTTKDLLAGLHMGTPGEATQRWTPVRLPGDKTNSFEIRINPRTARQLNLHFRHFRLGRGHGLLLELKNVSFSTKGRNVLDKLVEFYKNCGSGKRPHYSMMHRLRRPSFPFMQHSIVLPGDVPLLRRIQHALERFFPRRQDGSVDVFQHKDSNGAVHFLPFDEVRREVNNLLKRTIANKDCIKISTDALTRALQDFRSQNSTNETSKIVLNNESTGRGNGGNVGRVGKDVGKNTNSEDEEGDNVLSFAHHLASLNSDRRNKVNVTSGLNVPTTSSMASVLAKLRKAIRLYLASYKENQAIPDSDKERENAVSVGVQNKTKPRVNNILQAISSDDSERKKVNRNEQQLGFDLSEATNRIKAMSSDESDTKNNKSSPNHDISRQPTEPVKIKTDDLRATKAETGTSLMEVKNNVSKVAKDSTSSAYDFGAHDYNSIKLSNASLMSLLQLVKALKNAKSLSENKFTQDLTGDSTGAKTMNKKESRKVGRYKGRHKYKHRNKVRVKVRHNRKQQSIVFHYKPKSVRYKMLPKFKDGDDDDADDVDEDSSEKYVGKGRFIRLHHTLRRKPRIKETTLEDDEEDDRQDNDVQGKVDDYSIEESYTGNDNNDRLLKKLRHFRKHLHASRKSPKLRVVVYDDDEDEKEPHNDSWQNREGEEFAERVHQDGNGAVTESPGKTTDGSVPLDREIENGQQDDQGETTSEDASNSDSDVQYLSDSIATDEHRHLRESDGTGVPNLEPYLKKHYEDEEGEESEEIKMFNNQDDKFGEEMENRISKASNQDDTMLNEKTIPVDEDGVPGRFRVHNLPFNIQEEMNDEDTSVLKGQRKDDSLGPQQIPIPGQMPSLPSVPSSQAEAITSFTPTARQGIDLSPNVVMPAEQSTLIPPASDFPQMATGSPVGKPELATFSGVNYQPGYQPSMASQMNSMMPQMPYPQVSSMMPMQTGQPNVATPLTPMMQPGQIRAFISRGAKRKSTSGIKEKQRSNKRHFHKSKSLL